MANPIPFYSRSARNNEQRSKYRRIEDVLAGQSSVFWAGKIDDEFLEYGNDLGFKNRRYEGGDPSLLIKSQLVVYCNMGYHFYRLLESINICCSYGVPVVWVHNRIVPDKWIWSFSACFVRQDLTPMEIWRVLCPILA